MTNSLKIIYEENIFFLSGNKVFFIRLQLNVIPIGEIMFFFEVEKTN